MAHQKIYDEATRLLQTGKIQEAITLLLSQLKKTPDDEVTLSILGSAFLSQNKSNEAIRIFQQAVKAHSDSFAAHADLGFAHIKTGHDKSAISAFEKTISLKGDFYPALCFLAKLYFDDGQYAKSREFYDKSLTCDPFNQNYSKIQSAIQLSRFAEVEEIARDILSKQQGHPKAAHALAHVATTVGAHEDSIKILEYALSYHPSDIIIRNALINSLEKVGNYKKGVKIAEEITRLAPEQSFGWQTLGKMHSHCGDYKDAISAYDKALSCPSLPNKERANLELLRGHNLRTLGDSKKSIEAYRTSIEMEAENGAGWWGLANLKTYNFSNQDRQVMKKLSRNTDIDPEQRSQAAFSLGKAHEDDGDYATAFDWYKLANDLRPNITFDAQAFTAAYDEIRNSYSRDLLKKQASPLPKGPTPIFIVGLPRSGSTLIEQILASHSHVEGTMELQNLPHLLRKIKIEGGKHKLNYPQSMGAFNQQELTAFGQKYLDSTALYRTDKAFFIDKLPPNFEHVGLIHMILPQAIIIDARRHPMDCGLSCYKQHFASGHDFSYDLQNIAHYYNSYLSIMDHWDIVLPGKVKTVQYEDLIENTEPVITGLLSHCNLNVEKSCFEFYKNKRAVRTASSQQVRQPIYKKSQGAWHNFEQQLKPLQKTLGVKTMERFKKISGI